MTYTQQTLADTITVYRDSCAPRSARVISRGFAESLVGRQTLNLIEKNLATYAHVWAWREPIRKAERS